MGSLNAQNNIGVYQITNQIDGRSYIGSSRSLHRRLLQHKSTLIGDNHYNPYLQESVNKHGIENFIFSKVALCPVEYLTKLEQWFLDNTTPLFNELKFANSMKGYRHTEETKLKISTSSRNRPPISEETRQLLRKAREGFTHTDESKKLIGSYNAKRFSKKIRYVNTGEEFDSIKEAAEKLNLCKVSIGISCRGGRLVYKIHKFIFV